MGRILLLAIAAYVCGGSSFDGRRPAALDGPLREFKRNIDAIKTEGPRVLAAVDRLRAQYQSRQGAASLEPVSLRETFDASRQLLDVVALSAANR
jgi:hypothetical protein